MSTVFCKKYIKIKERMIFNDIFHNKVLTEIGQKYNKSVAQVILKLDDWGEESADDTIALVEYFLNNYNIDKSRVYISGASGGRETLSLVKIKKGRKKYERFCL